MAKRTNSLVSNTLDLERRTPTENTCVIRMSKTLMEIKVLLFAAASEVAQDSSISVDLNEDARASDVLDAIAAHVPAIASLLPACRLAVDGAYVPADFKINANSEIALIPPVSGG